MQELKKYSIPFEGLKLGDHSYEYLIDEKFFEEFENSEIEEGKVKVDIVLSKQENMLLLDFDIHGYITLNCDRCWERMNYPVESKDRLIFKLGEENQDSDDEIIFVPESEFEINVAQHIYDFINLALPRKRVHKEGDCNEKALRKLEELNIENENKERMDPRWAKLAQLKEDKK